MFFNKLKRRKTDETPRKVVYADEVIECTRCRILLYKKSAKAVSGLASNTNYYYCFDHAPICDNVFIDGGREHYFRDVYGGFRVECDRDGAVLEGDLKRIVGEYRYIASFYEEQLNARAMDTCDSCDFKPKSKNGLAIHKARKHKKA